MAHRWWVLGLGMMMTVAQAKPLRFPDPVRYEASGQRFSAKPFAYSDMIQRLGQPTRTEPACIWESIEYPQIAFYDIDETPKRVLVQSIHLVSKKNRVVFKDFVLNNDTAISQLKKYQPRYLSTEKGVVLYQVDVKPMNPNYDGYGYLFYFKNQRLIKFSLWESLC